MNHRFVRQVGVAFASLLISTAALAAPEIGKPAPDFTATDALSGQKISLSEFKGKLVTLEWQNPECPFVKKFYSVGAMQQLQENAEKRGVVWITINSSAAGKQGHYEDDAAVKKAVADKKSHATYFIRDEDGSIGKLYDAKTTPHMFVINKEGTLAYMGAIDDTPTADPADIATAKNYVTRALDALTKNTPVKATNTKPYGCGVKYAE